MASVGVGLILPKPPSLPVLRLFGALAATCPILPLDGESHVVTMECPGSHNLVPIISRCIHGPSARRFTRRNASQSCGNVVDVSLGESGHCVQALSPSVRRRGPHRFPVNVGRESHVTRPNNRTVPDNVVNGCHGRMGGRAVAARCCQAHAAGFFCWKSDRRRIIIDSRTEGANRLSFTALNSPEEYRFVRRTAGRLGKSDFHALG